MAGYRTHITVSGLLGAGYGTAASLAFGYSGIHGALAGCLTGVAGMLPDLDSESGRPVREVFGLTAALAPLVTMHKLLEWGGSMDGAMLLAVLLYVSVRYGGALILGMAAVHRGMFHSIPALLIAAELTFLAYHGHTTEVRLLMALGVALGFASHLVLDEIYSVQWNGMHIKLKASAGSALKFMGNDWTANFITFSMLLALSYVVLIQAGLVPDSPPSRQPHALPPAAARDVSRG